MLLEYGHMLLVIVKMRKLLGPYTKNNCKKKKNQKEFRIKKVIKRKDEYNII